MSENLQQMQDDPNPDLTQKESPEITPKPSDSESGEKKEASLLNEKTDDKKSEKAEGAPEKYEAFKLPEGFEANEAVMTEAQATFKELGLPQAAAQKLVDFYAKVSAEAADGPVKFWQDQQKTWKEEIKADPEIGGKLGEVRATVAKAIDGLGDPKLATAFREAMDYTGAGNNPAFIRVLHKLASKVTEGSHVSGSPAGSKPKSGAQAMYPNLPSAG